MFRQLFEGLQIEKKNLITLTILTTNALVWFYMTRIQLGSILENLNATSDQVIIAWLVYYSTIILSLFVASVGLARVRKTLIVFFWISMGCVSTFIGLGINEFNQALIFCGITGFSCGFGLPCILDYFTSLTTIEGRGRISGVILTLMYIPVILLFILFQGIDIITQTAVFTVWRGSSLIFLFFNKLEERNESLREILSFSRILSHKPFLLYFIPWLLFNIVNEVIGGFMAVFVELEFFWPFLQVVTVIAASSSTFVVGLISDFFGRKRVTVCGFIMLGLASATLSLVTFHPLCLQLYAIVDGVAWGIFLVIFVFTIWGDLFPGKHVEKLYALGVFPLFLKGVVWFGFANILTKISPLGAFSLSALFLFVAVIPLMYTSETVPLEFIEFRKMRKYIQEAKKLKERYS